MLHGEEDSVAWHSPRGEVVSLTEGSGMVRSEGELLYGAEARRAVLHHGPGTFRMRPCRGHQEVEGVRSGAETEIWKPP